MGKVKYLGEGIAIAQIDGNEVDLREAVSTLAISIYEDMYMLNNYALASNKKKELEEKIIFQSKILDSLSNAYSAVVKF